MKDFKQQKTKIAIFLVISQVYFDGTSPLFLLTTAVNLIINMNLIVYDPVEKDIKDVF